MRKWKSWLMTIGGSQIDRTRDFSKAAEQNVTVCALGLIWFLFSVPSLLSQGGTSALQARALEAGRNGEFSSARQDLEDAARQLKAERPGRSDLSNNAQRIAALSFVQLLHKVAADCVSGGTPASVGAQLYAAGSAARKGDLNAAVSEAAGAVAKSKSYAPAHALLGRVRLGECLGSGRGCEAAIQSFREAVRLDPGLLVAELDLAMAFTHTDDSQGAISAYQRVLELDRDRSFAGMAHAQLALLHAKRSNWAVADQHSKEAASLGWTLPLGLAEDIAKNQSGSRPPVKKASPKTGQKRPTQPDIFHQLALKIPDVFVAGGAPIVSVLFRDPGCEGYYMFAWKKGSWQPEALAQPLCLPQRIRVSGRVAPGTPLPPRAILGSGSAEPAAGQMVAGRAGLTLGVEVDIAPSGSRK